MEYEEKNNAWEKDQNDERAGTPREPEVKEEN